MCHKPTYLSHSITSSALARSEFVTSLSSLRPRSTLSSCLTIRPSAIPSVKSRPRGCARKSLARKLQAAEKPVFSTATAAARRGSRRRPAFRRAKRSAPHRQQMEAERCATVNYFRSALYFSHPLTLQYERDAVSGKLAVSTFLALPTQRNLHTGADNHGVVAEGPIAECCHVGSNGGKR
jgi:hypothetical protein